MIRRRTAPRRSRSVCTAAICISRRAARRALDPAWRRFEALYQKYIRELVRCLARNPLQAADVGEALLVDLFLPDRSGQSRIALVRRAQLAGDVAARDRHAPRRERACAQVEHRRASRRHAGRGRCEPGPIHRGEHRARALRRPPSRRRYATCCRRLTPRERQMLVWRYQRGLLLEQIAARLSVHTSTVCRQLERLHDRIRSEVIATLSGSYGMNAEAISECLRDLLDNLAPPYRSHCSASFVTNCHRIGRHPTHDMFRLPNASPELSGTVGGRDASQAVMETDF